MSEKNYVFEIFDQAGTTKLGEWLDAPVPGFSIGAGGTEGFTITLPRPYGEMDMPGDVASRETVVTDNRVRILVEDDDTAADTAAGAAVGEAVVGEARVGLAVIGSQIVWQGFIAATEPAPPAGVAVTLVPLSRILNETPLEAALTVSGDPVAIARSVVAAYLPGLGWDIDNPASSGEVIASMTFAAGQTIGQVLEALRRRAGSGWLLYVSELGTVRMVAPATTATHTLVVGVHAFAPKLKEEATTRRKKIVVHYANGGVATAQAADYLATDPRAEPVNATEITNGTDAARQAALLLVERNRVLPTGTCTVIDRDADLVRAGVSEGYNIEGLRVGEGVSIQAETDSVEPGGSAAIVGAAVVGDATVGAGRYAEVLPIARITYRFWWAELEFGRPRLSDVDDLAALEREVAALTAAVS